jgi:hypothetical protein
VICAASTTRSRARTVEATIKTRCSVLRGSPAKANVLGITDTAFIHSLTGKLSSAYSSGRGSLQFSRLTLVIRNVDKELVAKVVREIIQDDGGAIPKFAMRALLEERGIEIHGSNPDVVLATMLWRMRRQVILLRNFGYWLTEKPLPAAGYFPDPASPTFTLD